MDWLERLMWMGIGYVVIGAIMKHPEKVEKAVVGTVRYGARIAKRVYSTAKEELS